MPLPVRRRVKPRQKPKESRPPTDMLKAEIVHCLPGRLRLRVAEKRGDEAALRELANGLAAHPEVASVEVRPVTGGLLVVHNLGEAWQPITRYAADRNLFAVTAPAASVSPLSIADATVAGFKVIDRRLRRATGGALDFQSAMFLTFVGFAVHQARQGHMLGPVSTLLLNAYGFLKEKGR
ncbi:HMA2 domain-containing protein [Methylococcus capsulatus]|uniref:HMA2 domain-containing protein n=1 Tax=Methylococcus capsulatus TaxID=414 RepID=UPI002016F912|nr:ABC transporter ATP-binding protein [Methylococcus capsulatus]UQN13214.1 ABC transporter ATP-binding protein [Methylococcus capsulatus]